MATVFWATFLRVSASAIAGIFFLAAAPSVCRANPREDFEMRVRPLLAKQCYSCHTQTKLGGLRLDSRETILKGGNSGAAAVAGNPDQSLLIQAVRHSHERLKMPPSGKLKPEEIAALEDWIRQGLYWPEESTKSAPAGYVISQEQRAFWSFQPVRKPISHVKNERWISGDLDRFVMAKLEEKGLRPAPAASRRTWLRRVTFDLTGLPPTPMELAEFLRDESPEAFSKWWIGCWLPQPMASGGAVIG